MARHDAVLIRVSTDEQEHQGQIDNVRSMLKSRRVEIPEKHWFIYTVSRRKVSDHPRFKEFIQQVEDGRIATAYVESRDRFGQTDAFEYFKIISTLCENESCLIALREQQTLTERSMMADVMAVIGTASNDEKLRQTGYQSLRTRAANFEATGTWPTGGHPFGYGKQCFSSTKELKWIWQPISRTQGITYDITANGKKRKRSTTPAKLPRKERTDIIKLVPSDNKKFVTSVQRVFDLYVNAGLSRRAISKTLNDEGLTFYDKPFSHSYVTQILTNPAYVGDTHFGKTQAGELCTFDADGNMTELKPTSKKSSKPKPRTVDERLVKQNTHEPLIDRKMWNKAQKKLASEKGRTNFAPRNPNYYLKPLFVCGHCGKNLTGRTENGKVVYVCSTYIKGKTSGHDVSCGYHRITHADAEQLLLDKIEELDLQFNPEASEGIRSSLASRVKQIEHEDDATREQLWEVIEEGAEALIAYFKDTYELDRSQRNHLTTAARAFYRWGKLGRKRTKDLPVAVRDFREAVKEAEQAAVADAKAKHDELTREFEQLTLAWAKASEMQQDVIKRELNKLEEAIKELKPRTLTVSQRLRELYESESENYTERRKLIEEWPTLENREKGEALRRLFNTVSLYWDATWHPNEENPARPRKTKREGRYSYELLTDLTEWDIVDPTLAGSW